MPYGHVLVPLCVTLRLLQIVDIQELVDTYSYKRPFQILSLVLMLLIVLSQSVRLLSKLLLDVEYIPLVPSLYHYNAISFPILPWPRLSCASHQKPVDAYFCQGEIEEPVYDGLFEYNPMLNTHSNQ